MKTKIKEIGQCKKTIAVTVAKEKAENEYLTQLRKIAKQTSIKGFRKGRAPIKKVESIYFEVVKSEFEKNYSKKLYKKIVEKEIIKPVAPGAVEKIVWSKGKEFTAEFSFETDPKIDKIVFEGLHVPFQKQKIKDSDIQSQLDFYRNKSATEEKIDSQTKKDDIVECSLAFKGSKSFKRDIVAGSSFYGVDFDKDLLGKKSGDSFSSLIDLSEKKDKSKTKDVSVKILNVKRKIYPTIDDEFAKDANFNSLEEMKKSIKEDIKKRIEYQNEKAKKDAIINALIEKNSFDVPESLALYYANKTANNYKNQFGTNSEEINKIFLDIAKNNLKQGYIVDVLKKQLNIKVLAKDREVFISEEAKKMKISKKEFKEKYTDFIKSNLDNKIMEDKIFLAVEDTIKFVVPTKDKDKKLIKEK